MNRFGRRMCATAAALVAMAGIALAQGIGAIHRPYTVSIGIGVDAHAAPSYVDHLNLQTNPSATERQGKVSTAFDLSIMPAYWFAPHWSIGLEYGLLLQSQEASGANGTFEYRYTVHMPVVMLHHGHHAKGYWWKAGGGVGYHFASLRQQFRGIDPAFEGHARGPALKLDASAGVAIARSLYGTAAAELRAAFLGTLRNESDTPLRVGGQDVNLQFFSFGLKLGLMVEL